MYSVKGMTHTKLFFLFFIAMCGLDFSSCSTQNHTWLETDKKEFEKLYAMFPNVKLTGEDRNASEAYRDIKEMEIIKGKWSGSNWTPNGSFDLTMIVTQ